MDWAVKPLIAAVLRLPTAPVMHTLSLHDALPISRSASAFADCAVASASAGGAAGAAAGATDPKSTRLNSSHVSISYAVFCLKKKSVTGGVCLFHRSRLCWG